MPESSLRVSIDWRRVSVTCKLAGAQCGTHLCHAISISSRAQVTRISAGAGDLIHFSLTFYCHWSDSYQSIVTHDQRCKNMSEQIAISKVQAQAAYQRHVPLWTLLQRHLTVCDLSLIVLSSWNSSCLVLPLQQRHWLLIIYQETTFGVVCTSFR